MPATGVHHVDLVVSSVERSLPFYRELLAPLGYHVLGEGEGERGETVWSLSGDGVASVGLREAPAPQHLVDREELGLHHLAFAAPGREAVDAAHAWLRERGAAVEAPPREYDAPAGAYAVRFHDPDGIALEVVHVPRD